MDFAETRIRYAVSFEAVEHAVVLSLLQINSLECSLAVDFALSIDYLWLILLKIHGLFVKKGRNSW